MATKKKTNPPPPIFLFKYSLPLRWNNCSQLLACLKDKVQMLFRISLGRYALLCTYFFLLFTFIIPGWYNTFNIYNKSSGNLHVWKRMFAGKAYVSYLTSCTWKWLMPMHLNFSFIFFNVTKLSCTLFWAFANEAFPVFIEWSPKNSSLSLIHTTWHKGISTRGSISLVGYIGYGFILSCWVFFSCLLKQMCLVFGTWGVCVGPLCWIWCCGALIKN